MQKALATGRPSPRTDTKPLQEPLFSIGKMGSAPTTGLLSWGTLPTAIPAHFEGGSAQTLEGLLSATLGLAKQKQE